MSGIIKGLSLQGIRETFDNIKESRKEFQRESKQKKMGQEICKDSQEEEKIKTIRK